MSRSQRPVAKGSQGSRRRAVRDLPRTFEASLTRLAIVWVVAVKVAGLILIFDPDSASAFEAPKSSFSLATASLLLGLIALAIMQFGLGIVPRSRLHVAVAAFVMASILSSVVAEDRYLAMFGAQRRLGLTLVIDMALLYLSVAISVRTKRDWAVLGGAVASAGLLAIGYGLVQYLGVDPLRWAADLRNRPPSTFGNPDKFGHFLSSTIVAAAGLAMLPRRYSSLPIRTAAATYLVAALVMALLIQTRGTVLGLAVGLPALGVTLLRLTDVRLRPQLIAVVIGAVFALAALAGAALAATPLGERVRGGFGDIATRQRLFIAEASVQSFLDRPVTGHGPDNFGAIYPRYRSPESLVIGLSQDSAHSWLLQTAATTGVLGVLSLAAIVIGSVRTLWRGIAVAPYVAVALFGGALAYWANGLVAIGSVSVDWVGWFAAGGATALNPPAPAVSPRKVPVVFQAAPLALALVLVVSGTMAFQANRELKLTRVPTRALAAAERAVSLDPGRAEHWFELGKARQARDSLGEAAKAFGQATDRAPHQSSYWGNLALALANLSLKGDLSMGGKDAAIAAARRGIESDPNYPAPYHVFALVANTFGDHAGALKASAAAIHLYKGESEYEAVAADAALRMQDTAAARTALEGIVQEKDAVVLRVALARISLKLNDPDSARRHLRRAIELDPQNAPARELLQQVGVGPP